MFGKRTVLEKQLVIPTLLANKVLFNDFNERPIWKKALFCCHFCNLLLLEILHIAYLFSKNIDIIEFATIEETITSTMEGLFRLGALVIYRKRYMKMLDTMQENFWPTQAFGSHEEAQNTKFSKTVNMFSHINTATAFVTMFVLLSLPFYRQVKEFPFKIWLPALQLHESPLFEIITVWQWVTNYWTLLFSIICYDYIFIMFFAAVIAQLQMLQKAIEHHAKLDYNIITNFLEKRSGKSGDWKNHEERCLALFRVCTEHHVMLTNFMYELYRTYSIMFLAQFAGTFNALCFSGYILVSVEIDDIINILHIVTYIIVHLIEIFILIKAAQEVNIQYLAVSDAAYASDWYKFSCPTLRKHITILIIQTQNPPPFTAAGFVACNLQGLVTVIRRSFSVITLLQTLEEK